jgi:ABC-type antimicrobial peptide transport system permease subunit
LDSLATVVRMVAQRSVGHWRLFVAMTLGATISAALMAAVIIYSDAVRDLGLQHQLSTQPPLALDVQVVGSSQRFQAEPYGRAIQTTTSLIDQHIGGNIEGTIRYLRSATFYLTEPGTTVPVGEDRPRSHLQSVQALDEHVRVVEGRLPDAAVPAPEGEPPIIEAAIGLAAAQELGVGPGDEFDLYPHWKDVAPVRLKVVGVIDANDINERYWFGRTDRFQVDTPSWPTYPFFVPEASILESVTAYLPDMSGNIETYAFIDVSSINSRNARSVENSIRALKSNVEAQIPITRAESTLDTVIESYREKLFFTRLPLFALMIQIAGIVLFYLVMVSTMVIERQAGEIALLKSRGAGTPQVLVVFLIEGLGIMAIATVVGPFIAGAAISLLGVTPPFEELSGGDPIDITLSTLAFGMALLGAALALGALLWPAWRASRLSISGYKQQVSRPPRQPVFFRYYLDLAVIGVAALGFYQLRKHGSLVTEGVFGDLSADPILLATPSLFMLMVALVFLRLFPIALRAVLWVARPLSGPTITLALTRMARSPLQHSRLILLLILATAVGMFAASFRSTLDRGYIDRAAYRAGAEARITDIREPQGTTANVWVEDIKLRTGVEPTPAVRLQANYRPARFASETVEMLGVRPDDFASVAYWRGDFGATTLRGLFDVLEQPPSAEPAEPIEVPADARYIGMWVYKTRPFNLGVRLRDADGGIWEYPLYSAPGAQGWQFHIADLTDRLLRGVTVRPANSAPNPGLRKWTFEGVYVRLSNVPPQVAENVAVYIDDLQVAPSVPRSWLSGAFADADLSGIPQVVNLAFEGGVSNFGPEGAEGLFEFSIAAGYARIEVSDLPPEPRYFYEVWLTGGEGEPVRLGSLRMDRAAGTGVLQLPRFALPRLDFDRLVVAARPETSADFDAIPENIVLTGNFKLTAEGVQDPVPTILEPFDDIDGYELVRGVSETGDPGSLSRALAPEGRDGSVARLSFLWGRGGVSLVAFRRTQASAVVQVVASDKFLDENNLGVGDDINVFTNGQYLALHIADHFELFPGWDPEVDDPLLVADFGTLLAAAMRMPGAGINVYANEAWFGQKGTVPFTVEALADKGLIVNGAFDREAIFFEQSSDPLVAASWEGILILSFAAVLLVSGLGFVLYAGLGAQTRSLEFAILRTMGLSGRQIFGVVTFEQAFVVAAGMAAGTLLGFPLSRLMISYMGLTEEGREPLPPLTSVVDWQTVATVYGLLGIVVAVTVVTLVALYSRLAVSRALRMGEL